MTISHATVCPPAITEFHGRDCSRGSEASSSVRHTRDPERSLPAGVRSGMASRRRATSGSAYGAYTEVMPWSASTLTAPGSASVMISATARALASSCATSACTASSPITGPAPRTTSILSPSSMPPLRTSVRPDCAATYAGTTSGSLRVSGSSMPRTIHQTAVHPGKTAASTAIAISGLTRIPSSRIISPAANAQAAASPASHTTAGTAIHAVRATVEEAGVYVAVMAHAAVARPTMPSTHDTVTARRVRDGTSDTSANTISPALIQPGAAPIPPPRPKSTSSTSAWPAAANPASCQILGGCIARSTSQPASSGHGMTTASAIWPHLAARRCQTANPTSTTTVIGYTTGAKAPAIAVHNPTRIPACQLGAANICHTAPATTGSTINATIVPSRPWDSAPLATTAAAYVTAQAIRTPRCILNRRANLWAVSAETGTANTTSTLMRVPGMNHSGVAATASSNTYGGPATAEPAPTSCHPAKNKLHQRPVEAGDARSAPPCSGPLPSSPRAATSDMTTSTSTEASQGCRDHHGRSSRTGSASGTAERRPADTTVSGRATARAATTRVSNPRTYTNHGGRSEEHTSELQSRGHLVCRLLLEKK